MTVSSQRPSSLHSEATYSATKACRYATQYHARGFDIAFISKSSNLDQPQYLVSYVIANSWWFSHLHSENHIELIQRLRPHTSTSSCHAISLSAPIEAMQRANDLSRCQTRLPITVHHMHIACLVSSGNRRIASQRPGSKQARSRRTIREDPEIHVCPSQADWKWVTELGWCI